jgi:hypothetical protein
VLTGTSLTSKLGDLCRTRFACFPPPDVVEFDSMTAAKCNFHLISPCFRFLLGISTAGGGGYSQKSFLRIEQNLITNRSNKTYI